MLYTSNPPQYKCIRCGKFYNAEMPPPYCEKLMEEKVTDPKKSWEERFKRFVFDAGEPHHDKYIGVDVDAEELKSFISQVREEAVEEFKPLNIRHLFNFPDEKNKEKMYAVVELPDDFKKDVRVYYKDIKSLLE